MTPLLRPFKSVLLDKQLYQYFVVGGLSACVDMAGFVLLTENIAMHYLVAATLSFVLSTLTNFFLCQLFVFKNKTSSSKQLFVKTYMVSLIGLGIHHTLLWTCFEQLLIPLIIAKTIAMGAAFFWNYYSRKYWVFAQRALLS